jgi:hypothetical protein
MNLWKDWPVFLSSKGMQKNSHSPKGLITAFLWMPPSWMGIW